MTPFPSDAISAGSQAFAGGLFEFAAPLIPANGFSEVLFLTSNENWASIVWGETESPGGTGAAGDLAGIKSQIPTTQIPLPATVLLMLPALAGLGFLGRRRKAA